MNRFGLLGRNIAYSYSQAYFTSKFERENISNSIYEIFDFENLDSIVELFQKEALKGFNITIPYKEQIIPFLDELSEEAAAIGAVNCVKIHGNKKLGFNTDAFGFENSLKPCLKEHHKNALVLGDGGAAKAVRFVLSKLNIPFQTVSRKGDLTYADLKAETIQNHQIIINCTPVGTFPNVEDAPEIPYESLSERHLLYDLIYNPEKTQFLKLGERKNAEIKNGYEMWLLQAEKSWEIWNQPL